MLKQYEDDLTLIDAEVESLAYSEPNPTAEINNSPVFTATSYTVYSIMWCLDTGANIPKSSDLRYTADGQIFVKMKDRMLRKFCF